VAILLSEYFGSRIQDYDIKSYATNIDDDALNTARRGEYSVEIATARASGMARQIFPRQRPASPR
jgi:chemotaxis methyl-accepting protein methylase